MPYITKRNRRLTILFRLILYFVLIFTITTIISSSFAYNHFSSSFKGEIMDYNGKVLNQLSVFSDEFILRNINELVVGLALQDPSVSNIDSFLSRYNETDANKWAIVLDIRYQLDNLILKNRDIVDSIFIYSKDQKLAVSQRVIQYIDERDTEISEDFKWVNDMYRWNDSILWIKTRNTSLFSNEASTQGDIITVVCTYPLCSTPKDAKGYIAVNIKEKSINNYLVKFNSSQLGQLMILDNTGSIISHSKKSDLYKKISTENFVKRILLSDSSESFTSNYDGTDHVVSYTKSKYNNWYYVSLVPTKLFYQKDYAIKNRLFKVSSVILIVVLILSVILSYSLYLPFKRILLKYMPFIKNTSAANNTISSYHLNEYGLLDSAFKNMSDEICTLQDVLQKNLQMIKNNFFNDLLCKRITSPENLKEMLTTLNLVLGNAYFTVAVFSIHTPANTTNQETDIQLGKYKIIEYINSLSNNFCRLIPVDTNRSAISIIINTANDDPDIIRQLVMQITGFCKNSFSLNVTASIGRQVTDLLYAGNSYTEARIAAQYKFIYPDNYIFYYADIVNINANVSPVLEELVEKLDKSLNLGNLSGIKDILEKFYFIATVEYTNYKAVRKEISMYLITLKQYLCNADIDFEGIFDDTLKIQLKHPKDIKEFNDSFLYVVEQSFGIIADRRRNKNSELVSLVERYILNNIQLELSLSAVADIFNISSQHLSKIFKEEKGVNYIDYVVICKIEKAKNLLTTTNLSIHEITDKTGYSHASYLARKLKELTGMTPSEYRRQARQKLFEQSQINQAIL